MKTPTGGYRCVVSRQILSESKSPHVCVYQISELETVVREAKNQGINPRAMVVINPGNPTGQCLDLVNMKEVDPPPRNGRETRVLTR